MALIRHVEILCPACGHQGRYLCEPDEHAPDVKVVWCDTEVGGCGTPFAIEVSIKVEMSSSTATLALPSARRQDALETMATLEEKDPNDF